MSGNKNSGNRTGRVTVEQRKATVEKRTPTSNVTPIKRVLDLPKISALPKMPNSPWKNKRTELIWQRLAGVLIRHKMLTELDMEMLELTVHAHFLMEQQFKTGNLSGNNVTKLHACLKSLGLTPDGRAAQGVGSKQDGDKSGGIFGHIL